MNIRSFSNPVFTGLKEATELATNKAVKSDPTADRDGDGKQPPAEDSNRRFLNEEEIEKVLEYLRANKGVIKNNLKVELVCANEVKTIFIKGPDDQVVRRIPEIEFYQILDLGTNHSDKSSGGLLNKSA